MIRCFLTLALALVSLSAFARSRTQVDKFQYINLSTMVADWPEGSAVSPYGMIEQDTNGLHGEWGFSALIVTEVSGQKNRVLLDTGKYPDTVIKNVERLGIETELCKTRRVVLTHTHSDHTGGLIALRNWIRNNRKCSVRERRTALSEAVVSAEFFRGNTDPNKYYNSAFFYNRPFEGPPRSATDIKFANEMEFVYDFLQVRYERWGLGRFIKITGPYEVIPGVWATGAIRPKMLDKSEYAAGEGQPLVVDDQAVVILTADGAVAISGCAHSGLKNTLHYVTQHMFGTPLTVTAMAGGWHLFPQDSTGLADYGDFLKQLGIRYFLGSHCTGLETVSVLRGHAPHLTTQTAIVDTVGTQFTYDQGLSGEKFSYVSGNLNQPSGAGKSSAKNLKQ